jgi:hypothetical protein
MRSAWIERSLLGARARPLLVDPRLLRRVIKAHRRVAGLGLVVPHEQCYAIHREALLALVDPSDLPVSAEILPDEVILLERPAAGDVAGKSSPEILVRLWRSAFHAAVHLEIERRAREGALSDAAVRARIDRIGQTEFDEIRATLRSDGALLPPYDDREAYAELVAQFLELTFFAPGLLRRVFPALAPHERVAALVGEEVDAHALLDATCPESVDRAATIAMHAARASSQTFSAPRTIAGVLGLAPRARWPRSPERLLALADAARARGNGVRAALLSATAAIDLGGAERERARGLARGDVDRLAARLSAALDTGRGELAWTSLLFILVEEAAARRGLHYPVEARLLYDLQRAAIAHEEPQQAVDVATFLATRGRRPVVRPLPATREVRVARAVEGAAERVRHVRVAHAERKLLAKLLREAARRADERVRRALGPILEAALDEVGLRPASVPERVAREKLVSELLDQAAQRGFLSLGHLRDALSRNQLKLDDLGDARELVSGDQLLRADRRLAESLDGVYRRGEVYLRGLQKTSSVSFGTAIGRRFTLTLALPLAGAFVLLEGVQHVVGPLASLAGLEPPTLLGATSFLATAAVLFVLLHSERARRVGRRALSIAGALLRAVFVRLPIWFFRLAWVRSIVESAAFQAALRRGVFPLVLALVAYGLMPFREQHQGVAAALSVGLYVGLAALVGTRLGLAAQEVAIDAVSRGLRAMSHRVLPGLFRLVAETFKALLEIVERAIYRVDEWLRFRVGEGRITFYAKAALGLVWFLVAYVIRLYTTLLIEPEINPLKHFPVVTVAHKILLPVLPDLLSAIQAPLAPLGGFVSGTIAGTTVFLLPSVFGFLVWELKENWKLYRASRARELSPARIGQHGETMTALLVPGLHSGTLPKLYDRMRRAARRLDEAAGPGSDAERRARGDGSIARHRDRIHEVEDAVRAFVERELAALLRHDPRWRHGPIAIASVDCGSNRIRVRLACARVSPEPCEIAFEAQSRLVVASIPAAGFVSQLHDPESRALLENAVAGLYKLAAVDLVRERIEAALGAGRHYDVADEGLLVWPGGSFATEVVYPIFDWLEGRRSAPLVRGAPMRAPPPPIEPAQVLFCEQRISWADWVSAWSGREGEAPRRLVRGASLLPGL